MTDSSVSKYQSLATYLRQSGQGSIVMTFAEIERVVGAKLPPSAFKYRAWWSNNPMNSVITRIWLEAGYRTMNVDMARHKLVFKKLPPDTSSGTLSAKQTPPHGNQAPKTHQTHAFSFVQIYGAFKGTVAVMPGGDLTQPTGEIWEAQK